MRWAGIPMRLRRGARPVLGSGAPPRRRPCSDPMLRRAKVPGCGARSHEPGDAPPRQAEDSGQDPSCTRQSPLTLATFRSWGGSQDDAARGAAPECTRLRPGSAPADGVTDATAGDWPRRAAVRYIPYPSHAAGASPLTVRDTRRIRLVAYGARLESVLGASPRGFESPILRRRRAGAPRGSLSMFLCKRVRSEAGVDSVGVGVGVPGAGPGLEFAHSPGSPVPPGRSDGC